MPRSKLSAPASTTPNGERSRCARTGLPATSSTTSPASRRSWRDGSPTTTTLRHRSIRPPTFCVTPTAAGAAYLEVVRAVYDRRRSDLAALSDDDLARPSWTPAVPAPTGDFWRSGFSTSGCTSATSHPLGRQTDDTGAAAEIALAEVESSLGYIVGKKVGLPDGKSITFHLTGPIARDSHVLVDGRAKHVDQLDHPDVEMTTDSTTFIQLACGRIDPQVAIDSGAITWKGDASWATAPPATSGSRCDQAPRFRRLPLRRDVPVRVPDVAVDPRGPRPDRARRSTGASSASRRSTAPRARSTRGSGSGPTAGR